MLPVYPLYAVLFAAHGLSGARISALFAVWSLTGLLTEVPAGLLADRWSRRRCLIVAGPLQAAGFLLWLRPSFAWYAAGFVCWGCAGALVSGAFEALLYDGLAADGQESAYQRAIARVRAVALLAQLGAAGGATLLLRYGGFPAVVLSSAALCCVAGLVAVAFPEPSRPADRVDQAEDAAPALTVRQVLQDRRLLALLGVAATVGGLGTVDEYFGLMARDWGVSTAWNPLATAAIPLVGAAGAALAARQRDGGQLFVPLVLAAAGVLMAGSVWLAQPVALVGLAVFYAAYQAVSVVTMSLVQQRIPSCLRATMTSIGAVAEELVVFLVYLAWAVGAGWAYAALVLSVAVVVALVLRIPEGHEPPEQ